MHRSLASLVVASVACAHVACTPDERVPVKVKAKEPKAELFTPSWAFEPWISKDISTGPDMDAFIQGFHDRDIPVGVAVLDSPWETSYNTFVPNEERYPDFKGMVARWRDDGIRTVLWVTQMVNDQSFDIEPGGDVYEGASPNFDEGLRKGYFVNDGKSYFWWKGTGAAVDFFSADARDWWHKQQDALLDMGIAGWKLDFGEQYITDDVIETKDGNKTLQEYSEKYYEDYLAYGQSRVDRGEFLTMVRPYDESYGFTPRFYARPEHAPIGWVGNQHRDWSGVVDALNEILTSADAGYAVLGSDIGGYLDNDNGTDIPFDVEVFQRWTAMSGMMPWFQLHGRANLAPWTVPANPAVVDETVNAYRYWAALHHAMVPYWYSLSRSAQLASTSMLHTVTRDTDWSYTVGDAFFVAPLFEPGPTRDVTLPDGTWFDWWDPTRAPLAGGTVESFTAPSAREIPVYVKAGAIIPLHLDRAGLIDDAPAFSDALTVLVYPDETAHTFALFLDAGVAAIHADSSTITLEHVDERVVLRVRAETAVAGVNVDGAALSELDDVAALVDSEGFVNDVARHAVWIAVDAAGTITLE